MTVQIDVELNEKWRDDIAELYTEFKSMDGAEVDLDADISRASQKIGALRGEVEALTAGDHELNVDADIDRDSLKDLKDVDLDLGKQEFEVDIDDDTLDTLKRFTDSESSYNSFTTRHETTYRDVYDDGDVRAKARKTREALEKEGLLDDMRVDVKTDLKDDKLARDLGVLLAEVEAMEPELEIEVCLKKCDDWDKRLDSIGADLDSIKEWEDRDGRVDVKLRGAAEELTEAVDRLEESDLDLDGDVDFSSRSDDSGDSDRLSTPGWTREDRKWMGGSASNALVTETSGQLTRLDNTLDSLGIEGSVEGNRFRPDDISVTVDMENEVIRDLYGDKVADSPAANFHRDKANEVARKRAFADVVREFDKPTGSSYVGRDYRDHGDFDVPEWWGMSDLDKEDSSGHPLSNILDREHGTNPFTSREQSFLNSFGIDMDSTGFFDSDDDSGMAEWFKSVSIRRTGDGGLFNFGGNFQRYKKGGGSTNWGKVLGFGGLPGFGGDGGGGGTGGGPGGMRSLKKLMPTMAKYWQFLALLSPMLITLAANAAGVAAAMGSIAVAGGAVIGLGLLGFGDNLNESLKEAKKQLKTFKKEMFGAFQPVFQQFSPFTEAFLATAPIRVQPIVNAMSGLTEFMPTFNAAFDGLVDWIARAIDEMVKFEPIISQLGMRFGSIFGDLIIDALRWFTTEAYKNQDVMISVGEAIYNVLRILYQFAQVLTYLTAIASPFLGIIASVASLISERWVAAMIAGTLAVYGIATAVGVLSGAFSTLMATSFSSMASSIAAFAATAITSFLAAAEALAVLIAGEATLLAMTGAGLALVAAGIAAGYIAYKAIAPSGTGSHLGGGGGGGAPGVGGGPDGRGGTGRGMGGGGGATTVINVEGDITKETLPDVEDAIQSEARIRGKRNPDS